ncbi:Fc.00g002280.m01.CDS01 [Cosmosporella sp. VM-42]
MPDPARTKAKRQRTKAQNGTTSALPASLQQQNLDVNTTALLDILQMPPTSHDLNCWGPMETGFNNMSTFPTTTFDSMPASGVFDPGTFGTGFHPSVLDGLDVNGATTHPPPIDLSPGSDLTNHALQTHNGPQHTTPEEENNNVDSNGWPIYQQSHHPHSASDVPFQPSPSAVSNSAVSNSYESDHSSRAISMRHYSDSNMSRDMTRGFSGSISPYSATNAMVTTTNRNLISDNLMRIYHDVLEHALSCWLSEETCPYDMKPQQTNGVTWLADNFEKLNILDHYEPTYQDNRIYKRVIKLDRVAQKTKLIQLTKSEDKAASKALHLAIMAFATQWAQGSQRERERFPHSLQHQLENGRSDADDMSEDFDRTLQRTFWAQAKRALQDCSDLECFRVVCADLIFGLAQKPMDDDDFVSFDRSGYGMADAGFDVESSISSGSSGDQSVASQISDIIAKDGPPVFMERAARKMHALKYQYEARETGILDGSKSSLGLEKASPGEKMSEEDRGTIGLVYWMTVMFDTVSSSMNGRPVVVSDEDCQHDPAYQEHLEHEAQTEYQLHDARWWNEHLVRENIEGALRFPCNYNTAVKGVIAAAPVKVLLFRHVSYLQNIVRSKRRGEAVEKIILNAMAVYRHWHMTYAAFFRDLVEHYDLVPAHIQSWFVCIVAHFHLAALLLTDLIELVDDNNLGIEYATQMRTSANVVARLRQDGAEVLSDLARVSTAPRSGDLPGSHASDLHFAVVEGSILTEPWTMILIRAFTKAAIIQLTEVEDLVRNDPTAIRLEAARILGMVKRCEDCTKALYCLGKKSDMARNIAGILSSALSPFVMRSSLSVVPT